MKRKHAKRAKRAMGEIELNAAEESAIETEWPNLGGLGLAKALRDRERKPIKKYHYVEELAKLQLELVKLQEWVRMQGLRVSVLFEGRDAAGKGGVIKRIAECLNPRVCR